MKSFLINSLGTFALVGIPTIVHYFWVNRSLPIDDRFPLSYSYSRALRYLAKWIATAVMIFGAIFTLTAIMSLLDIEGAEHQPSWAIFAGFLFTGVGYVIRKIFKLSLYISLVEKMNHNLTDAWKVAAMDLGIKVVAPFRLIDSFGR